MILVINERTIYNPKTENNAENLLFASFPNAPHKLFLMFIFYLLEAGEVTGSEKMIIVNGR